MMVWPATIALLHVHLGPYFHPPTPNAFPSIFFVPTSNSMLWFIHKSNGMHLDSYTCRIFQKKKTNFWGHEDVWHKRFQQIDQSKETILKPQLHLNSILPLLLPLQTKYTSSHKSQQIYLFPFYIFFTSFSSLVPSCVIHKFHSLFCFGD